MIATRIMRMVVAVSAVSGAWCSTLQAQSEAKLSPGSSKTYEPQDKQKRDTRPVATRDKVHPDVRSELDERSGWAYVLVTLKPLPKDGLSNEQRKAMAKERQDKLLASLAEGDFKVDHRFETEPRMIGHVNARGLAKLAKQPDAPTVQLSKFEPGVIPAFNNSPDGEMYVIVTLHHPQKDGRPLREHGLSLVDYKRLIRQHSSKVMNRLTHQDFEINRQSKYIPSFTGLMKAGGIDILAVDPDVKVIYQNKVHTMGDH